MSDMFPEDVALRLIKAQIIALHKELNYLSSKGIAVDCTSVGDLALGTFMLFKAKWDEDRANVFLKELVSAGVLDSKYLSRHAYLYAVGGCFDTPGGRYEKGVKQDPRPTSTSGLESLYSLVAGNSPKAISLRELFISTILSKQNKANSAADNEEMLDLSIKYYLKMEQQGLLIGTRGHNYIISAYIKKGQFSLAIGVLDRIDVEQRKLAAGVLVIDHGDSVSLDRGDLVSNSEISRRKSPEDQSQYPYYDPSDVTEPHITGPPVSFGPNLHSFIPLQMSPFLRLQPKHKTEGGSFFSQKPMHDRFIQGTSMTPADACKVANRLIRRMQSANVVPDASFVVHTMEIGRAANNMELILRTVDLAHDNFNKSIRESQVGEIIQPPTALPEMEYRQIQKNNNTPLFSKPEIAAHIETPVLNLTSTNRPMATKSLTIEDMTEIYHLAMDGARLMKQHEVCLDLLYKLIDAKMVPSGAFLKNAMKSLMDAHNGTHLAEVLKVYENIPKWGGKRDKRHHTLLIQTFVRMGRLADAWKGIKYLELEGHTLMAPAYRAMLQQIMLSFTDTGESVELSKRKMTREQKIEACTYCILHLVQYKPDWELRLGKTEKDLRNEAEVLKRFTQGVAQYCLKMPKSEPELFDIIMAKVEKEAKEKEIVIALNLCREVKAYLIAEKLEINPRNLTGKWNYGQPVIDEDVEGDDDEEVVKHERIVS
eukprot:CAMPEP_0119051510 /NCGR_PEP_ID=MMETSP1177-20130426/73096_1 /TAXON_ID=2985 /ORGANISM="Ochromonas sp, Strain CCMP1899" /LENGTH=708 /DNA_ID=CAMNT_0007030725 /DNA_START=720 /DNA_END=2846 /DNA_ORIENTATION=+